MIAWMIWQQVAEPFLMSAVYCFLKWAMYLTNRQAAVVTLEIRNSGLDRLGATDFLTLRHPCLAFDSYFVNHWARSTKQPLC